TIPGVAASQGRYAAALDDYGKRSYIAGRVANEPAALARWIVEPASLVPGTLMPNMGATPAEAQDMAAYLGQLR
ncbi:MAG: cytochrome c, partial [Burkholderiaceae bacterium]